MQQIHRRFLSGVNSKIEEEGEEISDEMEKIANAATKHVTNKNIDISNLHPIFQELIRIQSGKPNGIRYHLMFLHWAISVYSRSGDAAYNAMKTIMRLPSISTLKSYINESKQHSGWQDKIASQMLESLTTNKIWGYGRVGFFSYDSFKIQKGLLWKYSSLSIPEKQKQKKELATQVHQVIWHLATHNFTFPIAYYRENRMHIKSFDWYASTWSSGNIVEVNFDKTKKSFHVAEIVDANSERSKFKWNVNELCEFKNPDDNQWYLEKIVKFDPIEITLTIEIVKGKYVKREWKVFSYHISKFFRPVYDSQEILVNYKTINPITGDEWFFISVYEYTNQHATAKATKLTKRHIWLTSWSKMRVDLAEHTLSKEVEDALASIDKLKNISEGTRQDIWSGSHHNVNTLEGLLYFGIIRELGGDSSTQTLKSYGHALNKYQVTALVSSEIKSINYGIANNTGIGINSLIRRNYQKEKKLHDKENKENKENENDFTQKYSIRLLQLSLFSRTIFKSIFADDLIMKRFKFPSKSFNNDVDYENLKIYQLQIERQNLIETVFYLDSIDELLQFSTFELRLNNYQCSGSWYQEFLAKTKLHNSTVLRLIAYLLLQKVIKYSFKKDDGKNQTSLTADCNLIPKNIIVLESAEASKFLYITGWIIYKLTKSDHQTKSHLQFKDICTYLGILSLEQSLILLLYEKHEEFGPNILQYIYNSLSYNIPLFQSFNLLLDFASQQLLTCKIELKDDKGTSSLRENLKAFHNDTQNLLKSENKFTSIKKTSIPKDPLLGLVQLRIWAQLDGAEEAFSKMLQVTELQWLLRAFGDNVNAEIKRKKNLIPLIFDHLKKETQFCNEMSESQFPRSLFPQFTEEELQEASRISHSSVNWTEYYKWVEAGEPFKEHDELMSMNQKLKNGSTQRRSAGTKQHNIIRNHKQGNGISSNKSDGKANQNARKKSDEITSNARAKTTACDETRVRKFKYDKKSNEMKLVGPNIDSYNVVPKESYMYTLTLPNNHFLMLRYIEERWFRCLAYLTDHESYSEFLNIFFTNKTTP
ncbi:hypothetical protein C1645_813871 [Glomus cerebriforme]|uniref:Uncharacterized protein n=1 Tax=Glomus cerebriforme TaxID=658196 RepID=A0A397TJT5_9GLOM|nr:hypothetical protein C1645_813871 [Glomus cerebriforme]